MKSHNKMAQSMSESYNISESNQGFSIPILWYDKRKGGRINEK